MYKLVIAVVLAVVQASVPTPRPSADSPATASKKIQTQPNQEQQQPKATPTSGQKKKDAASADDHSDGQANKNSKYDVTIHDPITVNPIKRDLADWAFWVFNFLLVLVGAFQIGILWRQAKIMANQIAIPYRARLAINKPERKPSTVRIPIQNRGQTNAFITKVIIKVIVIRRSDRQELFNGVQTPKTNNGLIAPGDVHFSLFINLPKEALGTDIQIVVTGTITYDAGFGISDDLSFIRTYSTKTDDWAEGWNGITVDFTKESAQKPSDLHIK